MDTFEIVMDMYLWIAFWYFVDTFLMDKFKISTEWQRHLVYKILWTRFYGILQILCIKFCGQDFCGQSL